jgi:hypothetical protein
MAREIKVPVALLLTLLGAGGGNVLGARAGGQEAKDEIHGLDNRLSVIETKVVALADEVKRNTDAGKEARRENQEALREIHDIDTRTEKILTILEERDL